MDNLAHILIVDDDPDIRKVLSLLLKESYQVAQAADGKAALQHLQAHPETDLVVETIGQAPHLNQLSSSSRCLKAWAPLSSSHVTKEKTRMGRGSVACLSLPGATAVGFEPRLPGSRVCVLYQQQY